MLMNIFNKFANWFKTCIRPKSVVTNPVATKPIKLTQTIDICYGAKLSDEFINAILDLCENLGWPTKHCNYLIACMAFETGRTFAPDCKNLAGSGATGLIQFMPRTAKHLGTTVAQLALMSKIEQLEYVEKHFKPYAKRISSLEDMYMAIFMPKYIRSKNDKVLFSRGSVGYKQNKGLDISNKGYITKGDACLKVSIEYRNGFSNNNVRPYVLY